MISKSIKYREAELAVVEWLIKNKKQAHVWLKKPVNNLEVGIITNISVNNQILKQKDLNKENKNEIALVIKNIFGKEKALSYKTIELINFEHDTVLIQKKSDTTFFSGIGYKILKRIKPESVLSLNKV